MSEGNWPNVIPPQLIGGKSEPPELVIPRNLASPPHPGDIQPGDIQIDGPQNRIIWDECGGTNTHPTKPPR